MYQVTPPLVICIEYNWYTKDSHGPLCFSHTDAGSGKKGSIKICLGQSGIQPNIAVILRGTGRSIADFDE